MAYDDPSGGLLPEFAPQKSGSWDQFKEFLNAQTKGWSSPGAESQNPFAQNAKNMQVPGAIQPTRNPLQSQIYNQQLGQAGDYAKNFQNYSDSLYYPQERAAQYQLQQTTRGIKNNYNARGLLNSGGEKQDEANAQNQTTANLKQTRASINQGLLGNAQGMYGNAFQSAANLASPGPQTALTYLQGVNSNIASQMNDAQMQSQAFQGIGQGVGSLAGLGLAGAMYGNGQAGSNLGYGSAGGGYGSPYATSANLMMPGMTQYAPAPLNPYDMGLD